MNAQTNYPVNTETLLGERNKRAQQTQDVETLVCALLFIELREAGVCFDSEVSDEAIPNTFDSQFRQWFKESLRRLAMQGLLRGSSGRYHATEASLSLDREKTWNIWREKKASWFADESLAAPLQLVEAVLLQFSNILSGAIPATDLLFPKSSVNSVEGVYRGNPIADHFNLVLSEAAKKYLKFRLQHDSETPISILEVGAGTGSTSRFLFDMIESQGFAVDVYHYTDISQQFLMHARKAFVSDYPYVVPKLLNVEKPLDKQGIDVGRYDLVVASNVLHATKNISSVIQNTKYCLRKGGLLLLNEMISADLYTHLTFGLLKGWWLYEDAHFRIPGCPGIHPDAWEKILEINGFENIRFPARDAHELNLQVIAAQSDGVIKREVVRKTTTAIVPENRVAPEPAPKKPSVTSAQAAMSVSTEQINNLINNILAEHLNITSEELEEARKFTEYGVDSIVAVNIVNEINARLGIRLQTTVMFDYVSVTKLSTYISEKYQTELTLKEEPIGKNGLPGVAPQKNSFPESKAGNPVGSDNGDGNVRDIINVRDVVSRVLMSSLSLDNSETYDHVKFTEIGVDSIVAVNIVNEINAQLGIRLQTTVMFDYTTMNDLCHYIATKYAPQLAGKNTEVGDASEAPESASNEDKLILLQDNDRQLTGVPETSTVTFTEFPPSRMDVYQTIRAVLTDTLNIDTSELFDELKFTEIGVDSIVAVNVVNELSERLGLRLQTTVLFDYCTVVDLGNYLEKKQVQQASVESMPKLKQANDDLPIHEQSTSISAAAAPARETAPEITSQVEYSLDYCLDDDEFVKGIAALSADICGPGDVASLGIKKKKASEPKATEVKIAVHAASLNFSDYLCVMGLYPNMPAYPFTPGAEVAGTIVAVGDHVTQFKVGDEVVALCGSTMGGHSSLLTISEKQVYAKPSQLSFEQAAAITITGVTALRAFNLAQASTGETVLIQTAAGGVGLAAFQLAKHYGLDVIATVGSEDKVAYLRSLGITQVINYRETDFEEEVRRRCGARGVDIVINTLSGDALQKGLNCLAPGGRYVEIAMMAIKSAQSVDLSRLTANQSFYSIDIGRLGMECPEVLSRAIADVMRYAEKGVLSPKIHRTFALSDIRQAYEELKQRLNIGKIVVEVPEQLRAKPAVQSNIVTREMGTSAPNTRAPIAIVGMSCRYAQSANIDEFWNNIANGKNLITDLSRWDLSAFGETMQSFGQGSFIDGVDLFDPVFFGISGLEASYTDPQQRIFLEECWNALEDGGYARSARTEKHCGVYAGSGGNDYPRLFSEQEAPAQSFWGNTGSFIPARIAYYLDLIGPAVTVDTACSSSLVAVHLACQALWCGEVKMALAGGVQIHSSPRFYIAASGGNMLSPTGRCYTFDDRADGFVPGEGAAALLLKRLDDALVDRDNIHAVISASGTNQDGSTNGITAPSGLSQERLISGIYERFNIDVESIGLVEAHGTGTKLGDPIEFNALHNVFRTATDKSGYVALGSVKTNLGHAASAAGVASVIKSVMAIKAEQLPPSLNYQSCNQHIQLEGSPFFVNTELRHWDRAQFKGMLRATVSSFGLSGTNAHLVVDAAPKREAALKKRDAYLVTLSAHSEEELQNLVTSMAAKLSTLGDEELQNISFTTLMGRTACEQRIAFVVQSMADLIAKLELYQRCAADNGWCSTQALAATSDSESYIAGLNSLAQSFTEGKTLEPEMLSTLFDASAVVISLPTYPFRRERYWVDQAAQSTVLPALQKTSVESDSTSVQLEDEQRHEVGGERLSQLAPELEIRRIKSSSNQFHHAFNCRLNGDSFFLQDHVVNGKKILPGVAFLELIDRCFTEVNDSDEVGGFEDIIWLSPAEYDEARDGAYLNLMITFNNERTNEYHWSVYETMPEQQEGGKQLCRGKLTLGAALEETIDIQSHLELCPYPLDVANCYTWFEKLGIQYGQAHRGLTEMWLGYPHVLAKIELHPTLVHTQQRYVMHPAVLDSAVQACVGIWMTEFERGDEAQVGMPFSLEKAWVYGRCTETMFVLITAEHNPSGGEGLRKVSIKIADETGRVYMSFKNLCMLAKQSHELALNRSTPALEEPLNSLERFLADQRSEITELTAKSTPRATQRADTAFAQNFEDRSLRSDGVKDDLMHPKNHSLSSAVNGAVVPLHLQKKLTIAPDAAKDRDQYLAEQWEPISLTDIKSIPERLETLIFCEDIETLDLQDKQLPKPLNVHRLSDCITQESLCQILAENPEVRQIIWVADDTSTSCNEITNFETTQENGVFHLRSLIESAIAMSLSSRKVEWILVTRNVFGLTEGAAVNACHAGVHGIAGALAKEFSTWTVRAVDLGDNETLPLEDIRRLNYQNTDGTIAVRSGALYRQVLVELDMELKVERKGLYRQGGVYLIVGGAGGIGLQWSKVLLDNHGATVICLGRSDPSDDIAVLERAYEDRFQYCQCDASDINQLYAVKDSVLRHFGTIDGIFNSAIVLNDISLARMSREDFEACYKAKFLTSLNMVTVFADLDLDFMVFFSSMQSFARARGQANYAAGCIFQDRLAHQLQREKDFPVMSINWGYWGEAGVVASKEYATRMSAAGFASINCDQGINAVDKMFSLKITQLGYVRAIRGNIFETVTNNYKLRYRGDGCGSTFAHLKKVYEDPMPLLIEMDSAGLINNHWVEELATKLLFTYMRELGLFESLQQQVQIIATLPRHYRRWVKETFRILEQASYVVQIDGYYQLAHEVNFSSDELWGEWNERKSRSNSENDMQLLENSLAALPQILSGKTLATEVMFPKSSMGAVSSSYSSNPISDFYNDVLCKAVVGYIEQSLKSNPEERIKILEVGAGTGGTSSMLFEWLKSYQKNIDEYCYTDVSKAFLFHAEEKFGENNPFLRYKILNINDSALNQGFDVDAFNVVIAANVFHASENIAKVLRNIKPIMKPGAGIFLNELSKNSLMNHLTFGLLKDWWIYEDDWLRIEGSPAVDSDCWKMVFQQEGFKEIHFPALDAHQFGQQIVIAECDEFIRTDDCDDQVSSKSNISNDGYAFADIYSQ